MTQKNLVIFASGSGSNALEIIKHFDDRADVNISGIITNREKAGVLQHAYTYGIDHLIIDRDFFYKSKKVIDYLKDKNCDLLVLAGFLWLIPEYLVEAYPQKIINIHPALLPKYGGKGMYGHHVHRAVYENKESKSGISIHYVNQHYDEGSIIFQIARPLNENDNPDIIASKVLELEHHYFKEVIDHLLCG